MLTIRLQRKGKKNQPFYKIIVTEEKNSSTRGRSVEELGYYNPLTKERSLNGERAKYWMSVGAKPSDTVYNMLVTDSVIEGTKIPKHKKSKKKEEPKAAPVASAEAPAPEQPQAAETPAPEPKTEEVAEQPQEVPVGEPEQKSGFDQNTKQEPEAEPEQKPDFNQNTAESSKEPAPEDSKKEG
ncbi:MAG: 30S ribosomal protein S16 [bacterium]|nr:30S ribosomal protein S16 [bacterium]